MLRGTDLCLSVVSSLNGVMDTAVIADSVACGGTPKRKVVPLVLSRLGTLGPWPIGAVARGVAAAPCRLWGVSVRAPPLVVAIV